MYGEMNMRVASRLTDNVIPIQVYNIAQVNPESPAIYLAREAEKAAVALNKYHKYGIRRTFHGFYYISHYYPLRAMDEFSPSDARETIASLAGNTFEIYLHYPFCEQICTFCHFHKRVVGPKNLAI